jgi:hypothetical protein
MNKLDQLEQSMTGMAMTQMDVIPTLLNFAICLIMAFIVRSFYIRRSFSLTGKHHVGSVLPILSAIIFLVIVVVKSSLALSLGLVGALSIVRFRTPIKEPEELVYLFLAIAIGLGYGAGHTLITTLLVTIILITIYFWLSNRKIMATSEYNMVLNWSDPEITFNEMEVVLKNSLESLKLIRLDKGKSGNTAVLLVLPKEEVSLDNMISSLQEINKDLDCSFFEAKTNW